MVFLIICSFTRNYITTELNDKRIMRVYAYQTEEKHLEIYRVLIVALNIKLTWGIFRCKMQGFYLTGRMTRKCHFYFTHRGLKY